MKKLNLFWILVDSARNYMGNNDDRGLPHSVLNFANKSLYFDPDISDAGYTLVATVESGATVTNEDIIIIA